MKSAQANNSTIDLPDNPAKHLTDWLFEIGPTVSNGMGENPIGWPEIAAWQDLVNIRLRPWEARLLRRLSAEFIGARHDARSADCPAPFDPIADDKAASQKRLDGQMKAMFAAWAQYAAAPQNKTAPPRKEP